MPFTRFGLDPSKECMLDAYNNELKMTKKALAQRNRELSLLNKAVRALNSSLELERVLVTLLDEVSRMLEVIGGSIWLIEDKTRDLICLQAAGDRSSLVKGWCLPWGTGIVGWIAAHGESIIVKDTQKDKRHFKKVDKCTGLEVRSIIGVPLKIKGSVTGVIQVVDTKVNLFNQSHLGMLEGLAGSAAISIENARLFEKAQQEIAFRRKTESVLRKKERELQINALNLKEANTALKVLLRRRDEDKIEFEERILFNVKELIEPYLEKIKRTRLNDNQNALLEILESNLNDIISPFARRMSSKFLSLTPKEIQIANLIKQGKTTKDIAAFMNVSNRTIDTHRKNLRAKLGIGKQRANLRTHLLSIQ